MFEVCLLNVVFYRFTVLLSLHDRSSLLTIVSNLVYICNFIAEEMHMLSLKIQLCIEGDAPRKSKNIDLNKYDTEQSVPLEGKAGWAPEPV